MNLHAIVAPCVAAINPWLAASLRASIGYSTNPDGTRTPQYAAPITILCQCQALQYNDIAQVGSLNIQGKRLAIYIQGNREGLVRSNGRGGDLITLPDGSVWLVNMVLENWALTAGWTKVCATLQDKS